MLCSALHLGDSPIRVLHYLPANIWRQVLQSLLGFLADYRKRAIPQGSILPGGDRAPSAVVLIGIFNCKWDGTSLFLFNVFSGFICSKFSVCILAQLSTQLPVFSSSVCESSLPLLVSTVCQLYTLQTSFPVL